MNNRLALGTVQFGLPYGIANKSGQVGREEAAAIIAAAWDAGVNTLDTAISYGDSERRLGEIGIRQWRVVTKLPTVATDRDDLGRWVQESVRDAMSRLGVTQLHAVLLHRSEQWLGPGGIEVQRALLALKERGEVRKIGVSIYGPEELELLWPQGPLDLVQTPYNVLDRRIATSGWLARLRDAGTEVHARSVFLQGLLLMTPESRPAAFGRWQPLWDQWRDWLNATGMSPLQACLRFAVANTAFERLIVGVDSCRQLQEILRSLDAGGVEAPGSFNCTDPELINPSRWRVQ